MIRVQYARSTTTKYQQKYVKTSTKLQSSSYTDVPRCTENVYEEAAQRTNDHDEF